MQKLQMSCRCLLRRPSAQGTCMHQGRQAGCFVPSVRCGLIRPGAARDVQLVDDTFAITRPPGHQCYSSGQVPQTLTTEKRIRIFVHLLARCLKRAVHNVERVRSPRARNRTISICISFYVTVVTCPPLKEHAGGGRCCASYGLDTRTAGRRPPSNPSPPFAHPTLRHLLDHACMSKQLAGRCR